MGMTAEYIRLDPGMSRWHAFYFSDPHAMKKGETADVGTVNVRMEVVPKEAGKFEVLTQKEVDLWAKELKYTPIGVGTVSCGCQLSDSPRKFNWTGVPAGHALNYILVSNPTKGPLYYRLLIDENKYVSFPAPIATAAAELAAAPAAAPAPMAAGGGPLAGEWFTLQPGTEMWFNFAYDATTGVNHDKTPEMAKFTLFVEDKHPLDDVFFDVFTDAEYQQLIKNGEDITGEDASKGTAIGCGTDNGDLRGVEEWAGNFTVSQNLHVRVREGACHADGLNVKLEATGKTLTQM
jgi:hypothetical protein